MILHYYYFYDAYVRYVYVSYVLMILHYNHFYDLYSYYVYVSYAMMFTMLIILATEYIRKLSLECQPNNTKSYSTL